MENSAIGSYRLYLLFFLGVALNIIFWLFADENANVYNEQPQGKPCGIDKTFRCLVV
jgi:hypothetical protein